MKVRTISGAVFVAVVAGFFCLRQFVGSVGPLLFNILFLFLCAVGTFEVSRALLPFTSKWQSILSFAFGLAFVPVFCIGQYWLYPKLNYLFAIDLVLVAIAVNAVISVIKGVKIKTFFVSIIPLVYPSLFLLTMMLSNTLEADKGFLSLLLLFVISPFSDTFAYLVGMTYGKIRKGNVKKLCPKLSPKKTWAGAIGGVIGGMVGAIVIYFIFRPVFFGANTWLVFLLLGLGASVLTECGDLFESFIKRRAGIKDMGKIMPGHGGVMDRIDGMLFASVLIYLVFLLV